MSVTPTASQIKTGLEQYKRGDRPWPTGWSEWYVVFEDGERAPVKYLYGLAMNKQPSTLSTNQIKAALRPLNLKIINIRNPQGADDSESAKAVVKSSASLVVGQIYARADLKAQFGIHDATINNGIFKPKGHDSVWLFVTKDKTSDRTQYKDALHADFLTMEGQTSGRTDWLLIDHEASGHELLLFHRASKTEHPGAGFVYEGPFRYESHKGNEPATFMLRRAGKFKHGHKRTWELALDAVAALGGPATPSTIMQWIVERHPGYNTKNIVSDLAMLAVNSPSRTSYPQNARPRRTDQGSEFDRLIKVGNGPGVKFEAYDTAQHGIWEIYADVTSGNRAGMLVRQVVNPVAEGLGGAALEIERGGGFDASDVEDARRRVYAAIVRRRGQPAFRAALLAAYNWTCAITGCELPAVLEAAHVHPYRGDHTNVTSNGLLLRADIHTLFDLGLIAIDSASLTVQVSPELDGTEYADFQGVALRLPEQACDRISLDALDRHRSRCAW